MTTYDNAGFSRLLSKDAKVMYNDVNTDHLVKVKVKGKAVPVR